MTERTAYIPSREGAFAELVEMEMTPGSSITDETSLKRAIVEQLDVYHHPTSTVAMGVEGLSVVGATIMIAEHIARRLGT